MQKVKEIDLTRIWRLLKRERKIIFITSGVTTFLAILYCIFATPIFTGIAVINPPKLTDASTSGFMAAINSTGALNSVAVGGLIQKADTDIIAAILNGSTISNMLIKKFDLIKRYKQKDIELTRMALDGKTSFVPDIKSGFLMIKVDDYDPKVARDMANYYIVALGQLINQIAYNKNTQKAQFFASQMTNIKSKLVLNQESLTNFENTYGITAGKQVEIATGLSSQLQAQLALTQAQLNAMSRYETPQNPDYQKLQATANSLKAQLEKLSNQPDYGDKLPALTGLAPELSKQYYNLLTEIRLNTEVYGILTKLYQSAKIDALGQTVPVEIQVIDYAPLPIHKSKPKRLLIIAISMVLGAFLSSIYIILKNRKEL